MLDRSHKFLVNTCLSLFCVTTSLGILRHLICLHRFKVEFNDSTANIIAFCLVVPLVVALKIRTERTDCFNTAILTELHLNKTSVKIFVIMRNVFLVAGCMTLLLFSTYFSYFGWRFYGTEVTANILDTLGYYELAEQVYRSVNTSQQYSSFAVWHTVRIDDNCEDLLTEERRNQVISQIYGKNSIQMADRYYYLGRVAEYQDSYAQAEKWLQKSATVYLRNRKFSKLIDALTQMTFSISQVRETYDEDCHKLVKVAAEIMPLTNEPLNSTSQVLLPYFARRMNDAPLANYLYEKIGVLNSTSAEYSDTASAQDKTTDFLCILFSVLTSGVGSLLLTEIMLLERIESARKRLLKTFQDSDERINALNELIILHLFRQEIDKAAHLSEHLIPLAEESTSVQTVSKTLASPMRVRVCVISRELVRTVIVSLILCWYYCIS